MTVFSSIHATNINVCAKNCASIKKMLNKKDLYYSID